MGNQSRMAAAEAKAEAATRRLSDFTLLAASVAGALLLWEVALKLKALILALPLALLLLWVLLIPVKLFALNKLWRWFKSRRSPAA